MEISCPRRGMQYDILHSGKSMIGNNNAEKNNVVNKQETVQVKKTCGYRSPTQNMMLYYSMDVRYFNGNLIIR